MEQLRPRVNKLGHMREFQEPPGLESQPSSDLFQLEEYGNALLSMASGEFRSHLSAEQQATPQGRPPARAQQPESPQAQPCLESESGRARSRRMSRFGQEQATVTSAEAAVAEEAAVTAAYWQRGPEEATLNRHSDHADSPRRPGRTGKGYPRSGSLDLDNERADLALALEGMGLRQGAGPMGVWEGESPGDELSMDDGSSIARSSHSMSKSMPRRVKTRTRTSQTRVKRELGSRSKNFTGLRLSALTGEDLESEEDYLTSLPPAAQEVLLGDGSQAGIVERPRDVGSPLRTNAARPGKLHVPSSWQTSDWSNLDEDGHAQSPRAALGPAEAYHGQAVLRHLQASVMLRCPSTSSGEHLVRGGSPRSLRSSPSSPARVVMAADVDDALPQPEHLRKIKTTAKGLTTEQQQMLHEPGCNAREGGAASEGLEEGKGMEREVGRPGRVAGGEEEEEEEEEEEGGEEGEDEEDGIEEQLQLERNLSLPHASSVRKADGGKAEDGVVSDEDQAEEQEEEEVSLDRNLSFQGVNWKKKGRKSSDQATLVAKAHANAASGPMNKFKSFLKMPVNDSSKEPSKGGASKKKPPKPNLRSSKNDNGFQDLPAPKRVHYQLSELQLATDSFDKKNILGVGGFGTVFFGLLPVKPAQQVAIKVLKHYGSQADEEFNTELELLSRLEHKHLVKLLGFCSHRKDRILVYEFMSNGSLYDHMHGKKREQNGPLSWDKRLRIMVGAARGLRYLHEQRPQVLHRDIKAANILLTEKLAAKVADFGCAKLIRKTVSVENEETGVVVERLMESVDVAMGTHGLMAPEILETGEVSAAGDIFSFGVVLLEIISGMQPIMYDKRQLVTWAKPLLEQCKWDELIDPCILDEKAGMGGIAGIGFKAKVSESSQLVRCAQLAHQCINHEPMARPSMDDVAEALADIYFDKDPKQQVATSTGQ